MDWFASLGREPFPFQLETWNAYLAGRNGLIQAPTGTGKTLAAALGVTIEQLDATGIPESARPGVEPVAPPRGVSPRISRRRTLNNNLRLKTPPFTLLWITPLRALASDTVESLQAASDGLGLNWSIELRTSDTSQTLRKKQRDRLPTVLVTTPESVSLLLSYADSPLRVDTLRCIVVDEWHELMGGKRGVQTELALARLRHLQPGVRTLGISATIGNTDEALAALLGPSLARDATIIRAPDDKRISLTSVLPQKIEKFPWAGHLGLHLVREVIPLIERAGTTLVFTNTRSQSELWFNAIMNARPDWLGKIAVHHGSIDRLVRHRVEDALRQGALKAAVCTSSLDLGVDFWPVDQVIQIGSPKSIARAVQRAGRSGHQPGQESRLLCVPTQAFELIEYSAARHAIEHRKIEPRPPIELALDVLAQHVVTVAAGGGFDSSNLLSEVRSTHAFADLTDEHWQWVLDFAERGGSTLAAYPRFKRIVRQEDGRFGVASDQIARLHRMGIGTITSDGTVAVQFVGGKRLGSVEESFVSKLRAGDVFSFAGRMLEFVKLHQMTAQVRPAKRKKGAVPRWGGGKLPMSQSLADAVRLCLHQAADGEFADPEMAHIRPILEIQRRWSVIPRQGELLIESTATRDGKHVYVYPFQGRLVHEGLSALLVYRLSHIGVSPITATFNDYGFELLSPVEFPFDEEIWRPLMSTESLAEDVLACVNSGELARRQFREIARIAGLLVPTHPGSPRTVRHLQASSELFFDVFREFDPQNLLLEQARREVLERQLEFQRLKESLARIAGERFTFQKTARLSPMAFPLWAERIQSQQLRLESGEDRIARLAAQLEAAAME